MQWRVAGRWGERMAAIAGGRSLAPALFATLLLVAGSAGGSAAEPTGSGRFGPLAALVGRWQGYGQKPDGSPPGLVERVYAYDLGGMFIRSESVEMFPPEVPGAHYDLHRDVEWISLDTRDRRYVVRGFYVEGFATRETLTVAGDGRTFTVESEEIENGADGMRTRRTLTLAGEGDELTEVFEIFMPGADYRVYQTTRFRRLDAGE